VCLAKAVFHFSTSSEVLADVKEGRRGAASVKTKNHLLSKVEEFGVKTGRKGLWHPSIYSSPLFSAHRVAYTFTADAFDIKDLGRKMSRSVAMFLPLNLKCILMIN
jgi:hypothetical protein